jgi:hypothetical protein
MTVPSTVNRNDYVGLGNTAVYAYSFRIEDEADLLVTVRDTDDVEATLVLGDDYTVSGVGDSDGGNITLLAGNLATDYALAIRRVVPLVQETDIRNQDSFLAEVHEDVFDRLTWIAQQQDEELGRSVRMPESIAASAFSPVLPASLLLTPGATIMVNESGTGFVVGPTADAINSAQDASIASGDPILQTLTLDQAMMRVTKETYGIEDTATAVSIVANGRNSADGYRGNGAGSVEVMGGFNAGTPDINNYAGRDSVALFVSNIGPAYMAASNGATTTYTATTVTCSSWTKYGGAAFDLNEVKIGDLVDTRHVTRKTGIVTAVTPGTGTITVNGWYVEGSANGTTGTPADGTGVYVRPNSKVWAVNGLAEIYTESHADNLCVAEFGALNKKAYSAGVLGCAVYNYGTASDGTLASGCFDMAAGFLASGRMLTGFQSSGSVDHGFLVFASLTVPSPTKGFWDGSSSTTAFGCSGGTHDWFLRFQGTGGSPTTYLSVAGNGAAEPGKLTTLGSVDTKEVLIRNQTGGSTYPAIGFTNAGAGALATLKYNHGSTRFEFSADVRVTGPYSVTAEHLEVRKVGSTDPYIDFTRNDTDDYAVRMQATADDTVTVSTPTGDGVLSGAFAIPQGAGAPGVGVMGHLYVDTTNHRLYVKENGTWKYAALT